MRMRALSVLAAVLLAVQASEPASAAWPASAAGSGRALGGTIAAPTAVAVTWDPVVHVAWTASASSWATGYRVLRSVHAQGPFTQIADVGAAVTTVDDSPGAGTHHYAVVAYRGSWTSALSSVQARADPTYVFAGSTGFTGTSCVASGGLRFDMQQGYAPGTTGELSRRRPDGPVTFCSDTFTTGQSLPGGTTTVTLFIHNRAGAACPLTAALSRNGTTALGSASRTISPTSSPEAFTWTLPTAATSLTSGDRLGLMVSWGSDRACESTYVHWNSSTARSRMTLPG